MHTDPAIQRFSLLSPLARLMRSPAHSLVSRATLVRTAALVGTAALLGLSGCGSASSNTSSPHPETDGVVCIENEPAPPAIGQPKNPRIPESQLWVNVAIPQRRIVKQIDQQLPQPLAQEKDRPVGAPGNATFKVTHGTPVLRNEKSGIQVRLPVSADISVCKPLGSTCLRYGECQPAFEARFSFQTLWDEHYKTDAPRGSISATKKCVIGLDVTSRIEKIAQDEVAVVERQMAKEWPNTNRLVRDAWQHLEAPLQMTPETCMHFAPHAVHYSQLKVSKSGDTLVGALGLEGHLVEAKSCSTQQKLPSVPAPQNHTSDSEDSLLIIPQPIPQEQIEQALRDSLSGSWGESSSNQINVKKMIFGDNQIALLLRADGEVCGSIWAWGHLSYQAAGNRLVFELDGHSDTASSEQHSAPFLNHLRTHGQVPLLGPAWVNAERAELLIDEMKGNLPSELKVAADKLEIPPADVQATKDGYIVLHRVALRLAITDILLKRSSHL